MDYSELLQNLFYSNFIRIEKDDRLLDIFPLETREKGVELWEKENKDDVLFLRVRLPYTEKKLELYKISKEKLNDKLFYDKKSKLKTFQIMATGETVKEFMRFD